VIAPPASPPRRAPLPAWALAAGATALGLALLLLWRVDPALPGFYPPCPVRALTGYHCPGCGSLRALHALLHGEVARAFRQNPLAVALLPLIILGLVQQARPRLTPWLAPSSAAPPWRLWAIFTLVVGYGLLRNLPFEPFTWLAPR
jgi:hypothetical protein